MTGDTQGHGRTSENTPRTAGSGIARRRLGGGILALGGALALTPIPLAGAAARRGPGSAADTGAGMESRAH
ncbi:serine hydrolase, partial [Streptomyces parvus]|nr:serine hydrolase [Streptomyces parvus]